MGLLQSSSLPVQVHMERVRIVPLHGDLEVLKNIAPFSFIKTRSSLLLMAACSQSH